MKRPTIKQAKQICESLNARAVIVLMLDQEAIAGSSYAQTKAECKQAGETLDEIINAIDTGKIPVWE